MRRALALALVLPGLAGCPPADGTGGARPVARVDKVILRVPLNPLRSLDGGATPQGILLEVFFERADRPGGLPVTGVLEVLLYEGGSAQPVELVAQPPFHKETYPNSALMDFQGEGRLFGTSYRLIVPWGPKTPSAEMIWIVAKYIPPAGPAVLSEPTSVPLRRT